MRVMKLQGPGRWTSQPFHAYGDDIPVDSVTGGTVPAGQTYGPVAPPPESTSKVLLAGAVVVGFILWRSWAA